MGVVKRALKIDDSLDVFAVHGVGGILGVVLVAVFAAPSLSGLGFADGVETIGDQLWRQLVGADATFVWAGIATVVLVVIVRAFVGLRVGEDEETEGLDRTSHGESGYNF